MRLLKLIAACLLLSLSATACSFHPNAPVYQEMLDTSFKGQHVGGMIEEFGPPDEKTADSYAWKNEHTWVTGGYWYDCVDRKTIYNTNGEVVGYIEEDDTCYEEEVTHKLWCDTTAFFDAAKTVTGFEFDGTDMDSFFMFSPNDTGCYVNGGGWFDEPELAFRKYSD